MQEYPNAVVCFLQQVMHFPMQVFKNINKILQYTDLQKQSSGGVL